MGKHKKDTVIYLHGDLDLRIIEARRLPNMDLVSSQMRRCFSSCNLHPTSTSETKNVKRHQHHGNIVNSDAYVTVCIGTARVARTRVISNSQSPFWNERFKIPLAHPVSRIEFHIKDNDVFGADLIGIASVPATMVHSGEPICDWFQIISSYGKPPKSNCAIRVEMKFARCDDNPLFKQGMAASLPEPYGINNCYFPVRKGCGVTLYQDAHVMEAMAPEIELEDGKLFKHGKCWEDICHAILEAHHLVYIVGWSIYHKVRLVREPSKPLPAGGNLTLGELLRYKSQEGVRVLLLVWDDKTSHNKFFIKTNGVMQTHDEETRKFFKHSSVSCVLAPRYASSKLSIFKQQVVGTLFTHHQKCVLVDTQASGNNRKITAFIGGLDLCDGRYDTPDHRLFQDLDTVFHDDVHNPSLPAGTKGPREPWHDLHCKVEGPAAYDILTNFEQRWKKATKWYGLKQRFKIVAHLHEDALIKLDRMSWILSPSMATPNDNPSLWVSAEEDPEEWHVQIFRSIDSGSVRGFPKTVYAAESENLVWTKNLVVDKSIQKAYIQAIRSAQHFIYIENQYFLGSSYAWSSYTETGADNLIPMELALKIVSKIRARERFAVYVVIPMWPEGVPTSSSVQQILFWQGQTMKMMYRVIVQELKSSDIDNAHPLDYLNFYCLGNREELPVEEPKEDKSVSSSDSDSDSATSQRFMIYVHSKGMVVDDEYVIVGSANINQRSLAGSRDTEIAMGAYQPNHTWCKRNKHPRGQVYGYRMSLWAEHMGLLDDCFSEPENLSCVRIVNTIAEENWKRYAAEAHSKLQGHILKYPIQVDINGKVSRLPGHETFPDVGGKVLGSRSTLPDALTT